MKKIIFSKSRGIAVFRKNFSFEWCIILAYKYCIRVAELNQRLTKKGQSRKSRHFLKIAENYEFTVPQALKWYIIYYDIMCNKKVYLS